MISYLLGNHALETQLQLVDNVKNSSILKGVTFLQKFSLNVLNSRTKQSIMIFVIIFCAIPYK